MDSQPQSPIGNPPPACKTALGTPSSGGPPAVPPEVGTPNERDQTSSQAGQIEYARLWMQQSQLFWSRLQTAALLHSGVLVGWYKLRDAEPILNRGLLALGIFLSVFVVAIMVRDSQYMDKMKKLAGNTFPKTGKGAHYGRVCGFIIVLTFPVLELLLLVLGHF